MKEWGEAAEKRAKHTDTLILHRDIFNIALMDCALERTEADIARRQEKSTAPPAEAEKIKNMMVLERERITMRAANDSSFRDTFNRYAAAAKALAPVLNPAPAASLWEKAILAGKRLRLAPERAIFLTSEQQIYDVIHKGNPYKIAP
jgi:hypothetical protein